MIRRGVLAGLGGLALAGCGAGGGLDRLATGERARVADVRSGETIVLDSGLVVRLTGIEAPNDDEPWARQSRRRLSELVSNEAVTLLYGGARRDRYDRALAHVRRDKDRLWIQEALIKEGCARVHTWPDNRALAATMLTLEARARARRVGLWALPDYQVLLPSEAADRRGFLIIEGKVHDVSPQGGWVQIRFAEGGLEARVRPHALGSMDKLQGRLVRLRGWRGAGGLIVDHGEAIELLRDA